MSPTVNRAELSLPAKAQLAYTGSDDPLEYYYRPHTAWLYRARLRLALGVLGDDRFESLLEVGYGSGILLADLAKRAKRVAGIDVHPHRGEVEHAMDKLGVVADLHQASLFEMPFAPGEFDCVVCLSVLEHVTELGAAFTEFERVMRTGAVAVVGFPVRNPVTDALFRLLGYRPREMHPSSHADIIKAAEARTELKLQCVEQLPGLLPRSFSAYVVMRLERLTPKQTVSSASSGQPGTTHPVL